jgi:hypothetical protein
MELEVQLSEIHRVFFGLVHDLLNALENILPVFRELQKITGINEFDVLEFLHKQFVNLVALDVLSDLVLVIHNCLLMYVKEKPEISLWLC